MALPDHLKPTVNDDGSITMSREAHELLMGHVEYLCATARMNLDRYYELCREFPDKEDILNIAMGISLFHWSPPTRKDLRDRKYRQGVERIYQDALKTRAKEMAAAAQALGVELP